MWVATKTDASRRPRKLHLAGAGVGLLGLGLLGLGLLGRGAGVLREGNASESESETESHYDELFHF